MSMNPEYNFRSVFRLGKERLGLLRCGLSRRKPGRSEKKFVTSQFAVVCIWEGEVVYTDSSGIAYNLSAGDAFIRYPDTPHDVTFATEGVTYYVAVPAQCLELLELTGIVDEHVPYIQPGISEELSARFEIVIDDLSRQEPLGYMTALCHMQELITDIFIKAKTGQRRGTPGLDSIHRACGILRDNLADKVSLPQLAKSLGMSYHTFRRRFRDQVGISPGEFRINRRIDRAKELICGTDMQLKNIPDLLGYGDYYSFSNQFKKFTGMSPKTFRKKNQI